MSNFSISMLVSAVVSLLFANSTAEKPVSSVKWENQAEISTYTLNLPAMLQDTVVQDTSKKKKNPNKRLGEATHQPYVPPLYLKNPRNYKPEFEINEDGTAYNIYERVGEVDIRRVSSIPFEDYVKYRRQRGMAEYFKKKGLSSNEEIPQGLLPNVDLGEFNDIFGGGPISIRPTGFATLSFSVDRNVSKNPNLTARQQRLTTFNFDQQIQLGVVGEIGKKLKLNANFDTQATFDFENELKLRHEGTEDQILQEVEAGNVSMQLGNSLIQGRQNLFGLKTRLRFGPVYVSLIGSTERGQVENIAVRGGSGGALETPFEKEAAEYDMNRHFFLSHYFRSRYEGSLQNLPVINSTLRVTRVEVWAERGGATQGTRNGAGFTDLGENSIQRTGPDGQAQNGVIFNNSLIQNTANTPFPDNDANNLFQLLESNDEFREIRSAANALEQNGFQNTLDFEIAGNMRKLDPNEFTVNEQLGYVSLNSPIPTDQVLFVAFEYTLDGRTFQVGEFTADVPSGGFNDNVLFLKMLKSSVLRPTTADPVTSQNVVFPPWDLMMKNIYNIGYGIKRDGFFLDIQYESGTSAGKINFLPDGRVANKPLLQVMRLDQLTNHTAPSPDFRFDFVEGLTIIANKGLVIFPVLEPFGSHLTSVLQNPNDSANYVFQALYDDTQQGAIQNFPHLNRFTIEGFYQSSSSGGGAYEIPLNTFNLAEGSVQVTQGGRPLVEGVDYQVDQFGGKIVIINPAVQNSNQEINVSYESSSLYNLQTKTLLGARVEYLKSRDLTLGATILNLREQPFNRKPLLGEEPINNTLWGFDGSWNHESDFITRLIDKLPLISTKETSNIRLAGEFAQFLPGQPRSIKTDRNNGIVFLDDFEAVETTFRLQGQTQWQLASLPQRSVVEDNLLQLPNAGDSLALGYTRGKLSWYRVDPGFFRGEFDSRGEDQVNNYSRRIFAQEIFPQRSNIPGTNQLFTFDLRYQPAVRGPYNYQSALNRLDPNNGRFSRPRENWAGITREVEINNDFEANNVEFIEFWMMDPFLEDSKNPNSRGGDLYINLGLVSEDVLPDKALSQENSLPVDSDPDKVFNSPWAKIPRGIQPTQGFANDDGARERQDVGLDGYSDEEEAIFYAGYLAQLGTVLGVGTPAYQAAVDDPSSDNFRHFLDDTFEAVNDSILNRYEDFNGPDGNTPLPGNERVPRQGKNFPDTEDLNENGSLNFAEQYWEYKVSLRPQDLAPGSGFIVDQIDRQDYPIDNSGNTVDVTWYQFRIPIAAGTPVNGINNFKSINYIRMYMTDWEDEVVMRLTDFQFVSTQWRRYLEDLSDNQQVVTPPEPPFAEFDVGVLSIEENSQKTPFPYVVPPEVERQAINGNTQAGFLQNERALQLNTANLSDGDARAVFKYNANRDFRQYDSLRMWVHAEPLANSGFATNFNELGDAVVFLRLGLDNDFNYYEYELPIRPSDAGNISVEEIWANEIAFKLNTLTLAKLRRNVDPGSQVNNRYIFEDGLPPGHKIIVKGTPKLSDVRNIMIGVRNPRDPVGAPISLEVWVNELRLTDFDQTSGWAGQANADFKLADFATVNGAVSYRSAGFGPLEQKVSDRPQQETIRYDIAATVNLHKLMPKKWGMQLPVSATYGEQRANPVYDPREADILTRDLVRELSTTEKDSALERIQDYRRNRSVALNNWKKLPTRENKKRYPWDVSNFDLTVAYADEFQSSATIERNLTTRYRGKIGYRYNFPKFSIEPFKKAKKGNPLSIINLSPLPTSVSVALEGNRFFEERKLRPANTFGGDVQATFSKNFMLNRTYNLAWSLTRNLQINFNAQNQARVDEVRGYWDEATQRERDSVGTLWENLLRFGRSVDTVGGFVRRHDNLINMGRNTDYRHTVDASYNLPFSQIPITDWINGNARYSASFGWEQAPEVNPEQGGTITNAQNIQGNVRVDLKRFYSKFKFLKKIQDDYAKRGQAKSSDKDQQQRRPPRQATPETAQDSVKKKEIPILIALKKIGNEILRIGMSIQTADFNFSQNSNMVLPGYLPKTDNFGLDFRHESPFPDRPSTIVPPTVDFILGSQRDIRNLAALNGWITQDTTLSRLYMQNSTTQFSGQTSVELFRGFRIELNVQRNETRNNSSFFKWIPDSSGYVNLSPQTTGSFSMTYIFANTAFRKFIDTTSQTFDDFSRNRQIISARQAAENPNSQILSRQGEVRGQYQNGYLGNNQDVLIPAFLASYGIIGPEKVSLDNFPKIPLPNWSINYNGLSNLPFLKEFFTSVTLRHAYTANYTIASFQNNLDAIIEPANGFSSNVIVFEDDGQGGVLENYTTEDIINVVNIQESFSPLLGVNVAFKSGVTSSVDYKRSRNLTLNVGSLQLTEFQSQDLAVSVGYRKDKLNWKFRFMGQDFNLENSMNFNFRLTMKDTRELNRTLGYENEDATIDPQYTRGTQNWIIEPSIDYVVNSRINIKVFFKQNLNRPYTTTSFDTSFSSGGFQIRFSLSE